MRILLLATMVFSALSAFGIEKYQQKDIGTAKVLVLTGSLDMPGIHDIASMLSQGIVGAQIKSLEGVGHMINMEKPEEFNRQVISFLKNL